MVVTVCLKAGLITNSWTWLTHCSIWGSIGLWFLFMFIYRCARFHIRKLFYY